ncbi:MAG TPA: DNA translocase FtsK 4TM domain-containing protein, partial [Aestuariivirga sp.]
MAIHHTFETDESVIPEAMRRFLWRRAYEISAIMLTSIVVVLGLALASWSADDPSLNHSIASKVTNWLGAPGAVVADLLMQPLGLACTIFVLVPLSWAAQLFQHKNI